MKRNALPVLLPLLLALALGSTGCQTMSEHKIASGTAIGAATGALAGGIIGHQSGHRTEGALIGAAAGGLLGAGVGAYLDKQAKLYQRIEDLEVQKLPPQEYRVPETGQVQQVPERLNLRMSSDMLFARGESAVSPQGTDRLREIANIMTQYPDTRVIVRGYTSSEGSDLDNTRLSERRADAVSNTLIGFGVDRARITSVGMGESNPIATNDTEAGRAQNRRVEIEVIPIGEAPRGVGQPAPAPVPPPPPPRYGY